MHNDLKLLGPTVKDVHSPSGQPFYAPRSFADLPDCPACKYGTPIRCLSNWVCMDCGAQLTSDLSRIYRMTYFSG